MTKAQALADFKENILPEIKKAEHNGIDKARRRMEWNNYTDALSKNKQITIKQYCNWLTPISILK
jgi:hypothetical protein